MNLIDFTEFEPFNCLRERIGTDKLGYFELFDPAFHLTGAERSQLDSPGVLQAVDAIKVLPDSTLALKNSRVLAYIPNESWYRQRRECPSYRLAWCAELESIRQEHLNEELVLTTRLSGDYELMKLRGEGELTLVNHGFVVCKQCLHKLRYKDFDLYRNRKRGYSQKVLSDFRLQEFYKIYQQYPLSFGSKPASVIEVSLSSVALAGSKKKEET